MPTIRRRHPFLLLLAAAIAFASPSVRAEDDAKTQTVVAQGLSFEAPTGWKASAPESRMAQSQLNLKAAEGDSEGARLVVYAFPGGAGGIDANVARWQQTFKDKDGKPPKVDVKTVKGKNVDATRVEIAGHYYPSTFPGQPKQPDKDNFRFLGGIVMTSETGYYLRLVGPDKTVSAAKADFDKLLSSIKVSAK